MAAPRPRVSDGPDPTVDDLPRYPIGTAAHLAGMHPQTLRQYDKLGLVVPKRSPGRGRRYSTRDIATLAEVQRLSAVEGINLAGIARILALEAQNRQLRAQVEDLRRRAGQRVFAVAPGGKAVPLAPGQRPARHPVPDAALALPPPTTPGTRSRAVIVWRG